MPARSLSVQDLEEGMVTARPLQERRRVLLNAGTALTAKHLHLLKAWGVSRVWVESDDAGEEGADAGRDEAELARVRRELDHRFSKCDRTGSHLRALRDAVESWCLGGGGDQAEGGGE